MKYWTKAMDALLAEGIDKGLSKFEIADSLNTTPDAVLGRMRRIYPGPVVQRFTVTASRLRQEPTQQPVDRDPCWRCGVRADVGCVHSRAVA